MEKNWDDFIKVRVSFVAMFFALMVYSQADLRDDRPPPKKRQRVRKWWSPPRKKKIFDPLVQEKICLKQMCWKYCQRFLCLLPRDRKHFSWTEGTNLFLIHPTTCTCCTVCSLSRTCSVKSKRPSTVNRYWAEMCRRCVGQNVANCNTWNKLVH